MKTLNCFLLTAALASGQAWAQCEAPKEPTIPDGAEASMQDMLDGQEAIKAFQSENMEYLKCLEAEFADAKAAAESAEEKAEAAKAMAAYSEAVDAYNSAVAREESLAGEFNTQIREYKAANADK
jgi:hypothetical protein